MSATAEIFGKNLHLVRNRLGLTQEEMAFKFGVTKSTVSNWENGKYLPDEDLLDQMKPIIGVDVAVLMSEKMELSKELTIDQAIATLNKYNKPLRYSLAKSNQKK